MSATTYIGDAMTRLQEESVRINTVVRSGTFRVKSGNTASAPVEHSLDQIAYLPSCQIITPMFYSGYVYSQEFRAYTRS